MARAPCDRPLKTCRGASMLRALFIFMVMFQWRSAQAIECSGIYQSLSGDQWDVTQKPLLSVAGSVGLMRMSTDIAEIHYFVQGQEDNHYLLMITSGPKYVSGVTAAMTWDENNDMRLTHLDGNKIYKLICSK